MAKKTYEENGVILSKKTIYSGDKIKLSYTGLLAQAGAQNIFLHVGYGDNWDNSSLIPMELDQGIFNAELNILENMNLGICFKDTADNWDNNSGQNYVYKLSARPIKKEENTIPKEENAPTTGVKKTTANKRNKVKISAKESK